jgi:hypothetical protein
MRYSSFYFIILFLVVVSLGGLQSCKPSVPSEYLSQKQMENVLYDYHLAQGMTEAEGEPAKFELYKDEVLKKYGISQADFDSSMVYYMRHADILHDIYSNVSDRITEEANAQGATVSQMANFGDLQGDTANIWHENNAMVLSPQQPFNYQSFSFVADTTFHKGDRVMMQFDTQFIYQDGMRDGIAVLAVTFKNDSVASTNVHLMNSQNYVLSIEDNDSLGIKKIQGYMMVATPNDPNQSLTTLKLMIIQNIKLYRVHKKPYPTIDNSSEGKMKPDSSEQPSPDNEAPAGKPQPVDGAAIPVDRTLEPKELKMDR